jgi:hypothetical protein
VVAVMLGTCLGDRSSSAAWGNGREGPLCRLSSTIEYRRAPRFFDPGNYDIYPPQVREKTAETGGGAQHQAVHAE